MRRSIRSSLLLASLVAPVQAFSPTFHHGSVPSVGDTSLTTSRRVRWGRGRLHPLFADTETEVQVVPLIQTNDTVTVESNDTAYAPPAPSNPVTSWIQQNLFLGIEMNPTIFAIATIYFVEGALGLARLAQTYLLKDELHLGPAELSALSGLFVLPWTIKPLYGFLSDGFPLFGYKRKSYLIAAGLLGGLSYGLLGTDRFWESLDPTLAITGTVATLIISSACIAMADVVADGIVVTKTRESTDPAVAGGLQSLCWGSSAVGGLLSAYFSGSLLEVMSVRNVFGLTAVLPLLVAVIASTTDEKPVEKQEENILEGVKDQIDALWSALKQPAIWRPALFLFLWQSTPTSDGAFFFFLSNDLGLGPEFLGRVRLVTAASALVGVFFYNQYLKTIKIKDILFWSTIASVPLGLIPVLLITHVNREIGIPDTALIYGDDVFLAALGQLSFMPTLVVAARLCPPGVEAVLFATLMSTFNGASTLGTEIGALMTKGLGITDSNFDNLALLTVICSVTSLYPLAFIGWLDGVGDVTEEEMEQANEAVIDVESTTVSDEIPR